MPRFVLLFHDCPSSYERPSHWDLMLEAEDVLRTWALAQLPRDWDKLHAETSRRRVACPKQAGVNAVDAEQLADHRRDYLEYEGPLSGDRGHVSRVEEGVFQIEHTSKDELRATLRGRLLNGTIVLCRPLSGTHPWRLSYQPSE
ncbi:MAG: hypothetical protein L0Z07_00770 [Planctomycetes bacterium]|nr:hypothetical protein [Planctomycetota bacterium]